jgi:hypothetical protein
MANLATINNNLLADSGIDPVDLIVGTGTVNYIPKFTAEGTIGNSIISQSSTTITIAGNLIANNGASSSLIFLGDVANTTASFFEPQNDGKTSYFGRENSLGNWVFATPVTPYSTVIGAYNSTAPIILGHTNAEVTIANGGATTFISSIATGGDINANTSSAALKANGYQVGKYSYFGYSTGYPGVIIGSSGFQSLFFNVDVSGNPSGSFSGNGSEYVFRNAGSFITPNSINNGYNTLLTWNSSGQVTIPGATTIGSLTLNGTFYQSTSNTIPVIIYGDSAATNGLFRIEIDEVNDSFGTGARTFLGDGGIDVFIGTGNGSFTPNNTYIALNHSGEISMGAGNPATKHLTISTAGLVTIENRLNFIAGSDATNHRNEILVATLPTWGTSGKPFFTDVASYGIDGYGIILQCGYSDGGDIGGMKITDDGIVMWGAGDEDLFRIYNEDTSDLVFRIGDNNYAYFISNLYMAGNLVATQSWVNSQGFITGGPYLPLTGGTVTGLVDFSFSSPNITFTPAGYSGSYKTILGTRANAEGVLQLGNNGINYIVAGNTLSGGALQFRVNATGNFLSSINGTTALDIASTGNATFAYNVTLSNSSGQLDVGGVAIVRGNGSSYATHYLTTGAVNVAKYLQYDATGNAKNVIDAGGTSYITGGGFAIGGTNATSKLDVTSDASANGITLRNRTGDDYAFFNWRNYSGTELLAETYVQRTAANTATLRHTIANGNSTPSLYLTIASTGAATFSSSVKSTRYLIAPSGASAVYNIVDADQLYAGSYNLQAGAGSAGFGGSLVMYGHSHATKAGYVIAGISSGSGGKFTVNNGGNGTGTEVFTVDVNGAGVFSSSVQSNANFISNVFSDTISVGLTAATNATYNYVGYSGYWGLRTSQTGTNFCLDTYNGGTPKNVLIITQSGVTTFSSSVQSSNLLVNTATNDGYISVNGNNSSRVFYGQGGGSFPSANSLFRLDAGGATAFQILGGGQTTIRSSLTVGVIPAFNPSGFGYDPNGYKTLILGPTSTTGYQTLCIGVDVSGNASGAFSGAGGEIVWRNTQTWITPNAANNGYNTLLAWNSSGQFTFSNPMTTSNITLNGLLSQSTTSTQPVYIVGDTAGISGVFRIQVDEVNDSFGSGARTFLGDGGIDIFIGTGNSSYTPANSYIALNHGGEISMGAGTPATKHFIISTTGAATFSSTLQATNIGIGNAPTGTKLFANQTTAGEWIATFKNYGTTNAYGVSIDMSGSTSTQSAFQVYTAAGNGIRVLNSNGGLLVGTFTDISGRLVVKQPYTSATTPIYFGNTSFTAWNRQSYDTFILQQDDVTSFRMVEKNGETTASDQVLTFSIGDGVGRIATSGQPLQFYVNGSPSGLAYQGLSGTQVLAMNTNGNAQFNYALGVSGALTTNGNITVDKGSPTLRLAGSSYGNSGARIQFEGWAPASGYSNWQIDTAFTGGNELCFVPSTTAGGSTFTNPVFRLGATGVGSFSSNVYAVGSYVASSSTTAEIRLQGGSYGSSYNTSLRSIAGAPGVLQMGNNGPNYILAGNTAAGGILYFRVNCATESVTAGSLALTLNSNATAQFESTVTASAFFESSDSRIKTLLENTIDYNLITNVEARLYEKNGVKELGYFAQDFEEILSSAVHKDENGLLNLSYTQVHTAKIAALEERVKELENQLKNK